MPPSSRIQPSAIGRPSDGVGAVVIAGGRASRFGSDKTRAALAGHRLLDHAVGAVPDGAPVVVVGPRPADHGPRDGRLEFVREDPPFAGPVAAVAAGLAALAPQVEIVLVLAADNPFAGAAVPRLLAALAAAPADVDGVIGVGPSGRREPLIGAYRVLPLSRVVSRAAAGALPHGVRGPAMHAVLAGLRLVEAALTAREAFDVDRPDDLVQAERLLRGQGDDRPPASP